MCLGDMSVRSLAALAVKHERQFFLDQTAGTRFEMDQLRQDRIVPAEHAAAD
jgi:hypothetical protein